MSEEKDLNEFQRVIYTFIAPWKTMSAVNKRPSYLVPYLIAVLAGVFAVFYNFEDMVNLAIAESIKAMEAYGLEMDLAMISSSSRFGIILSGFGSFVGIPVSAAINALLLQFLTKIFGRRDEFTFKKAFSIALYAGLITALCSVVLTLIRKPMGDLTFNLTLLDLFKFLNINIGSGNLYLTQLFTVISIPSIWFYGVLGIAINKTTDLSLTDSILVSIVNFIVTVIFSMILIAMNSMAMTQI